MASRRSRSSPRTRSRFGSKRRAGRNSYTVACESSAGVMYDEVAAATTPLGEPAGRTR
jgi:hypothetical protein